MAGNMDLILRIRADLRQAHDELGRLTGGLGALDNATDGARAGLESISAQLARNERLIRGVTAAWLSFRAISASVVNLFRSMDAWTSLENRLRLVTQTQDDLAASMEAVFRIAQASSQPLASTATVYQRFAQNADRLGLSLDEVASVTETVAKAIAISGGSSESANAALVQFGQALASGVLRGEEFNSVSEQAPGLLKAIADGLDVDIGRLRKMAAEGELTADKLVTALQRAASGVEAQFGTRVKTIAQGMTEISNAYTRLVGEVSKSGGFGGSAAGALTGFSKTLEALAEHADALASGALVALSVALGRVSAAAAGAIASSANTALANRAAALAAVERAAGELQLQQRLVQVALAEAAVANAALASARADVAAARAKLTYAESFTVLAVRERLVAQRTTELAAATNALTAAEARATAATNARSAALGSQAAATLAARNATTAAAGTGLLASAGRGLMSLMGGPAGLVATVGLLAASFITLGESADRSKSALSDLAGNLDEAKKKIAELSTAQQQAEMVKLRAEIAALRKEYVDAAREIAGVAKGELRGIFGEVGPQTRRALEIALEAARRVGKGAVADWDALAKAVAGAGDMHDDLRGKLLLLIGQAQKMQASGRDMSTVLRELETAAAAAAGAVKHLGTTFDAATTADVEKEIDKIRAKIADLKDPSAAGKFDRNIRPTLGNIDPKLIDDYRRAVIELAAAEEALRKGRAREKRDPAAEANLSKARELTQQLAQAEQQLAQARAGVFESATKARDALEIWLATDENALKLSARERAARLSQADAVDAATRAYAGLADAKRRAEEITTGMQGVELELLKLKGDDGEAARREFISQYRDLIGKIQTEIAAGNIDMQVHLNAVLELQGLSAAKTQLDDVLARIEKIQDAQGRDENTLQTQIEAGVLTEIEGRDRLFDIHRKTAAELERIRPLLVELSQMPGTVGEQAAAALQKLDDQARQLQSTVGALQGALKDGLTTGITDALTGLAQGTMDLREAVTALGEAVLDAMLKIAAQHIAESATNGIMGLIGSLMGEKADKGAENTAEAAAIGALSTSASGLTTATSALTQAVAGLTSAAGSLSAAGGVGGAGSAVLAMPSAEEVAALDSLSTATAGLNSGTASLVTSVVGLATGSQNFASAIPMLINAAMALAAAAGADSTASAVGAVAGAAAAATGGLIGGFSPNDRADNIPAWLTAGEFVTRRPVMRQAGALAFMTHFNRVGMDAVEAWARRLRLPGYADGGVVLPAPAPGNSSLALTALPLAEPARVPATTVDNRITLNLVDSEERIAGALRSRAGEKAITVMLSRDPAKFRQILGL